ncbi:hypothetical protein Tco_0577266, partial [Tanacetum coccineum]
PPGSPPLQPPPLAGTSGAPGTSRASGSSQLPLAQQSMAWTTSKTTASAQQSMAWTTSYTRYKSTGIARAQEISLLDDLMHDESGLDEQ